MTSSLRLQLVRTYSGRVQNEEQIDVKVSATIVICCELPQCMYRFLFSIFCMINTELAACL